MSEFVVPLFIVVLLALLLVAISIFVDSLKKNFDSTRAQKIASRGMQEEIENEIDAKLLSFRGRRDRFCGKGYVDLIQLGYFSTLKTGNHGEDFDDKRQLQTSKRFSTPSVIVASKKVGETFEQYYI